MAKLRFGISSIIGLAAALAAVPTQASVNQAINDALAAARLAPAAKYIVDDMASLAALQAKPGDIVTVVAGETGAREVREVVTVDGDGIVTDSIIIERERSVEVPVTETVLGGEGGVLALQYPLAHGLASIANFGNVLHVNADTGEHSLYPVTEGEGNLVVDAELAGAEVKVQYSRSVTLAVSDAQPNSAD
jgi:hypothetical protein